MKFHGALGEPAYGHLMADDLAQYIIGRAERPLQQERPGLTHDHRADEERNDEERHDDAAAAEILDHRQREGKAEQELDGDIDGGKRIVTQSDQRATGSASTRSKLLSPTKPWPGTLKS